MQCNIDAQGARFRMVWGIMNLVIAVILVPLALWSGIWWVWVIVAGTACAGAFAIFEARKKWCVLRAMGLKTHI